MASYVDFCRDVVSQAGRLLMSSTAGRQIRHAKSSDFDIVTEADYAVQQLITQRIHEAFPAHGIVAEEAWSERPNAEYVWYVDPIDGTINYWHNIPLFSVSLALCRMEQPIAGAIHAPALGELFWAAVEEGAFSSTGRLHVSSVDRLDRTVVATGFPYQRAPGSDNNLAEFQRVTPFVQDVRRLGSAALELAYVAAGRFEGYWEFETQPWDTLAGELLVTEAGGRVSAVRTDGVPGRSGGILATNGHIHAALRSLLLGQGMSR
jgi:myo-inositol-1(or 4)-monophosphatase